MICEERSLFSFADFVEHGGQTTMQLARPDPGSVAKLRATLTRLVPSKSRQVADFTAANALTYIQSEQRTPRILIIGAGDDPISDDNQSNGLIFTDVALGPLTDVVADGHDLPFPECSFDGVIAAAVMEHVIDPFRVAAEVWRVLKPRGAVYASTPFMQQVHMGRYDFHRFTPLGHRRLWRWFDQERAGIANGPAMAFAWSLDYLLRTVFRGRLLQSAACYSTRLLTMPLLFLDGPLRYRPAAFDAASGCYFFGHKRETPVSDSEILGTYPGAQ